MVEFGFALAQTVDAVYLWGEDRTAVAVPALALALRANPAPTWVNVRPEGSGPDPFESEVRVRIPPERSFVTRRPDDLRPVDDGTVLPEASREVDPLAWEPVAGLDGFLRMPRLIRRLAVQLLRREPLPVVLLTNVDRLVPFYPEDLEFTRGAVRAFRRAGLKLIVAYTGPAHPNRVAFDHVRRVSPTPGREWTASLLLSEHGTVEPGTAGAAPTRLDLIDSVRNLLPSPPAVPARGPG